MFNIPDAMQTAYQLRNANGLGVENTGAAVFIPQLSEPNPPHAQLSRTRCDAEVLFAQLHPANAPAIAGHH
ncbi:MAG TPA: hypothetical protein VGC82_10480, partial [Rhodopila sp.]